MWKHPVKGSYCHGNSSYLNVIYKVRIPFLFYSIEKIYKFPIYWKTALRQWQFLKVLKGTKMRLGSTVWKAWSQPELLKHKQSASLDTAIKVIPVFWFILTISRNVPRNSARNSLIHCRFIRRYRDHAIIVPPVQLVNFTPKSTLPLLRSGETCYSTLQKIPPKSINSRFSQKKIFLCPNCALIARFTFHRYLHETVPLLCWVFAKYNYRSIPS